VIHLAATNGGHLELLVAARSAFDDYRRVWVTTPSDRAEELIASGEDVRVIPPWDRRLIRGNLAHHVALSLRLVAQEKPEVVVTAGAGETVAFCVFGRLTGAEVIFTESVARVTSPSSTGRWLSRLTPRVFVQWPEVLRHYPHARLCRPQLPDPPAERPGSGQGTFVAVGTHDQPFDRMLRVVDEAVESEVLPLPALAQSGHSRYAARQVECRRWIPPLEMDRAIAEARYVVMHGGSGLLTAALRAGHRPIVMARRCHLDEHMNDHQLQLSGKLEELGLAVNVTDRIDRSHLERADEPLPELKLDELLPDLGDAVRSELESIATAVPA
jgi:UDP-N-acetylglucosamine--N-acetylmuramyl-(pentapeptide) pyrophosphoryl-undecaprenol N-acetylglucosamine transferase